MVGSALSIAVCIAIALLVDSFNFSSLSDASRLRSIATDIGLPIILGGPISLFLLTKLRELAIANGHLEATCGLPPVTTLVGSNVEAIERYFVEHDVLSGDAINAVLRWDNNTYDRILRIGHSLGSRVVAEGVETLEQAEVLSELGCDEFQGFAFARPLPSSLVPPLLAKRAERRSAA